MNTAHEKSATLPRWPILVCWGTALILAILSVVQGSAIWSTLLGVLVLLSGLVFVIWAPLAVYDWIGPHRRRAQAPPQRPLLNLATNCASAVVVLYIALEYLQDLGPMRFVGFAGGAWAASAIGAVLVAWVVTRWHPKRRRSPAD